MKLVRTFWFLVLSMAVTPVFASSLVVTPQGHSFEVGKGVQYLEDQTHELSFDQVRADTERWKVSDDRVFNMGYNESSWWLKFTFQNTVENQQWLLEISYAVLDFLEVYVIDANNGVTTYPMGDKSLFHNRPIEHRYFVVPLELSQNEQATVYIKVKSSSSVQVPITLWDREVFNASDIGRTAIHGLYYGGLVIIAIYNLLIYLALGERTYLYYVGYVLAMFSFMASLNGWAFQFLWPHATLWNDTAILISLDLVVLFGVLFTRRFLDIEKLSSPLNLSSLAIAVISATLFVLLLFLPYSMGIRIIIVFAVFGCFWALFAGLFAWRRGHQSAAIYVVAWSGLLVGGVILALNKIHIFPRNVFTDYATQMGSLMEVLLLSFALAERINKEKALRFAAQQEALTVQQQANEDLEKRVTERTLELEEANKKLQELSDTDQLTGLKNRRYLNQYIDKEISRGARYQHDVAILLIDIDHFKSVNDTYGHLVGDDCLQQVAKRISDQMRWPTDLAARYGGEEFCIVLPETELQGASIVAERVRANVKAHLIETRHKELDISVSIGVYAAVPKSAEQVNEFIALADEALYRAKDNGRNRVESTEPQ
ncbi:MAG: diguanylate cyclase [Pseudomonadales bacterium]|nr:diguanylate cyclase [Pseudomonadales bacterium]